MKIHVSDIVKTDGASLNIKFENPLDGLNSIGTDFKFNDLVSFEGQLANIGGILKLNGILKVGYSTLCFRCLKEIEGHLELTVNENFVSTGKVEDLEAYTYEGNNIEIDKVLVDNIILNLPMKQTCSNACKGLCQRCGSDLNEKNCECKDDDINPHMEVLRNFFK